MHVIINDMANLENESSLDRLNKKLYRTDGGQSEEKVSKLSSRHYDLKNEWNGESFEPRLMEKKNKSGGFLTKVFIASFVFFVIALGISAFVLFYGTNVVSGRNIEIQIKGPSSIKAGDEINLQTIVINKNKTIITGAELVTEYPSGTISPDSDGKELRVVRQSINDLEPGGVVTLNSRAIIFGEQNSEQVIKVTLEYRVTGSNAVFTKNQNYKLAISLSPISIDVDLPEEVNANRVFPIVVEVASNSKTVLRNVIAIAEFPPGFKLISTESEMSADNYWSFGDMPAGSTRTIKLTGIVEGQDNEIKSFRWRIGSQTQEEGEISLEYGNVFSSLNLKRPFVSTSLAVNGQSGEAVVSPNQKINVEIKWANNLQDKVINGRFVVELPANLIDPRTVVAKNGYFNSQNNTIVWDKILMSSLGELKAGDRGIMNFNFNFLPEVMSGRSGSNPNLTIKVGFTGTRISDNYQNELITSEASQEIKVATTVRLLAKSLYYIGPFKNSGPVPPKVGSETTYTLVWTVKNTFNKLGNVKVKTVLPTYVKWIGSFSPLNEKVIFNPLNNEVIWELGDVEPGVGIAESAREMAFQVAVTPSLSQLGNFFSLTNVISLQALDTFTNKETVITLPAIDSRLLQDPNASNQDGLVVE